MKALLTGANSLVNKVLLEKLDKMGYEIVAHYHSNNDITADIRNTYPKVTFIQADFADSESFANFLKTAADNGKYDAIVNGAGGENRTLVTCLEGRYISHYTTPAHCIRLYQFAC